MREGNHGKRRGVDEVKVGQATKVRSTRVLPLLRKVERRLSSVELKLSTIEGFLRTDSAGSDWLTTREAAPVLGRAVFTIRQWCNQRRLRAQKTGNGREWRIHQDELERYRRDGLLPV